MAFYFYECLTCAAAVGERELTSEEHDELVLFETKHSMVPNPEELAKATICPRCGKNDVKLSYKHSNVRGYIRGNGYLDKTGVRRDMNLHNLVTHDPYAEHRVDGEVDQLKDKLKKSGQHDPKPKHFIVNDSKPDS